jgi:hypothetical protein
MRRTVLSASACVLSALLLLTAAGVEPVSGVPERTRQPSPVLVVTQEPESSVLACEESDS